LIMVEPEVGLTTTTTSGLVMAVEYADLNCLTPVSETVRMA